MHPVLCPSGRYPCSLPPCKKEKNGEKKACVRISNTLQWCWVTKRGCACGVMCTESRCDTPRYEQGEKWDNKVGTVGKDTEAVYQGTDRYLTFSRTRVETQCARWFALRWAYYGYFLALSVYA